MKEGDKDSDGGYHSENFSTFYFFVKLCECLVKKRTLVTLSKTVEAWWLKPSFRMTIASFVEALELCYRKYQRKKRNKKMCSCKDRDERPVPQTS